MQKSAIGATVAASCAGCSMFFAEPSWAADRDLFDVLLGNGAITQAQYDSLLEKEEPGAEEAVEAVAMVDSGGFNVDDDESRYSIKIGTRLHAEASAHDGSLPAGIEATAGTEPRRARIETKGTIDDDWNWVAEVDFADNTEYRFFDRTARSGGRAAHFPVPHAIYLLNTVKSQHNSGMIGSRA